MPKGERQHLRMGKFANGGGRQRLNVVIGAVEQDVLQIDEIAGNMQRDDLPTAILDELVAEHITVHDHGRIDRPFALAQEIFAGAQLLHPVRQGEDRAYGIFIKRRMRVEPPGERVHRTVFGIEHRDTGITRRSIAKRHAHRPFTNRDAILPNCGAEKRAFDPCRCMASTYTSPCHCGSSI